jgi:hypothetical protein
MDPLSAFGLFAVTAMLVCYALERSPQPIPRGARLTPAGRRLHGWITDGPRVDVRRSVVGLE